MADTIAVETAEAQRREWLDTRPQDQFAGRGKFTGCRQCGSPDRMQAVHRETLTEMTGHEIRLLVPWYRDRDSLTDDYLYYPCPRCNRSMACNQPIVIPNDYVPVLINEVLTVWRIANPMQPDCAALGRREPVSQI